VNQPGSGESGEAIDGLDAVSDLPGYLVI